MDGVGEDASHAHAPLYPYLLGIHGTVWGFGLIISALLYFVYNTVNTVNETGLNVAKHLVIMSLEKAFVRVREGSTYRKGAPLTLPREQREEGGPFDTSAVFASLFNWQVFAVSPPPPPPLGSEQIMIDSWERNFILYSG